MYVQATQSRRGRKTYVTHQIRESFRTPDGPRSRTLCNISMLPPEVIAMIKEALRGREMVPAEALELESALDYGGLAVLADAWDRFGLDRLLAPEGTPRQRALLKAMVFSRLLFPCSKLGLAARAEGTLLAAACGLPGDEAFGEDDLYGALDALTGHWTALEKGLAADALDGPPSLVLYDLTSVYFEGDGPEGWSRYGHSRDHRGDRPQVVLAVAADARGVPLHISVLRGNRTDTRTLRGLLAMLRRRFGLAEAVFVFDGGMSSRVNLERMEAEGLKFVTRLSQATLDALLREQEGTVQLCLDDRDRLMEITHDGKRHVLAGGPWRARRDRERRELRLARGEAALRKLASARRRKPDAQRIASQAGRALDKVKAHKYFRYRVDEEGTLRWETDREAVEEEAARDGWFLLRTNLEPEAADAGRVLGHYKNLLEVEDAFRELKSYLEVRPVFHRRPDRVINHVRICFLACWISARLGVEWRARGERGEVPRILRRLQGVRLGRFRVAGTDLEDRLAITRIPSDLNAMLSRLDLLGMFRKPPRWASEAAA